MGPTRLCEGFDGHRGVYSPDIRQHGSHRAGGAPYGTVHWAAHPKGSS